MTAKEYFSHLAQLKTHIKSHEEQLVFLRSLSTSTAEATNMEKELSSEISEMLALYGQAVEVINGVKNTDERAALTLKYINNYSYGRVANELHITKSTAHRWIRNGLEHAHVPELPISV